MHDILRASAQFLLDAFPGSHVNDSSDPSDSTFDERNQTDYADFIIPINKFSTCTYSMEIEGTNLTMECWEANLLTVFDICDPNFCDQIVKWVREGVNECQGGGVCDE